MKMKKLIALMGAAVFLISGCGNTEKEKGSINLVNDGSAKITEVPTELTIFFTGAPNAYLEELPVWQEIAKRTNVSLKTVNSKSVSDVVTAFNTLMASGELPDIVVYGDGKASFSKFGMDNDDCGCHN